MKKIIIIVVVVILALGSIFFKDDVFNIINNKVNISSDSTSLENDNLVTEEVKRETKTCFLTKTKSELSNVSYIKYLELIDGDNSQVSGKIIYLNPEKEHIDGNFVGVYKNEYLNIIYSYFNKEGINIKEQKIFRVYEDLIIEAENINKKDIAGVNVFQDIKYVVFGNDGIFSKVSCAGVDKKELSLE